MIFRAPLDDRAEKFGSTGQRLAVFPPGWPGSSNGSAAGEVRRLLIADLQAHHRAGTAQIVFGPAPMQGQCLEVANRMAPRSLASAARNVGRRPYDRPRYLVQIVPTKMLTWDGAK